ncbi:MAG: hypothetical protein E7376_01910 [Clostridiales bacterium]|nr:hypothetical protein [Clostridiales bacterium]
MIYKKSVVLSSVNKGKEKGVLTLEYDGGEMLGNVRLYNFSREPEGILSVGILHDGQVFKAGLTFEKAGFYTFKLNGTKNLEKFSCAVVNFVKGEATPLLHGATNGAPTTEERLANSLCVFDQPATVENVENTLDANGIFLQEQSAIDEYIDQQISACENGCVGCKYRDAFFKQEDSILPEEDEVEEEESFFDGIKEQITTLFEKYPEEEFLKQIIPDSKWVKIDYEEKGEYYVVGLMYENDQIKYVCYGVPSVYNEEAPKDIKGFAQWLPIDISKEQGFGYWITYQDATTGENVKLEFENV